MSMQTKEWGVLGESVVGANHKLKGLPNQDYFAWETAADCLILAVADGHGSPRSFRSDKGSEFAVQAFISVFQELFANNDIAVIPSLLKRSSKEQLPRTLSHAWKKLVDNDLENNPILEGEADALMSKEEHEAYFNIEQNRYRVYGSTILGVVADADFVYWLQLGDGDILVVTDNGEVIRPIENDPNLLGNETTSLCNEDAPNQTRQRFLSLENYPPQLIMLSTDGYSNSYSEEADFLKVATDYLQLLNKHGAERVEQVLQNFLNKTSEQGSGDDITVGLVYRANLFSQPSRAVAEVNPTLTISVENNDTDPSESLGVGQLEISELQGELSNLVSDSPTFDSDNQGSSVEIDKESPEEQK